MKYLRLLPSQKTFGPDEIENIILKNMPRKAVDLAYIANAMFMLAHFPTYWKEATMVPILKHNWDNKKTTY